MLLIYLTLTLPVWPVWPIWPGLNIWHDLPWSLGVWPWPYPFDLDPYSNDLNLIYFTWLTLTPSHWPYPFNLFDLDLYLFDMIGPYIFDLDTLIPFDMTWITLTATYLTITLPIWPWTTIYIFDLDLTYLTWLTLISWRAVAAEGRSKVNTRAAV